MKNLGNAAILAGALAGPVAAEDITLAAQSERDDVPFSQEMAIIQETRDRALATCNIDFTQRLAQLGAVIDNGEIEEEDRPRLIAQITEMGNPTRDLNELTNAELVQLAGSMPMTNLARCNTDVYAEETDSYRALSEVLQANIAALRAETASLQDFLQVLEELETFSNGDAAILQEINAIRSETVALWASVQDHEDAARVYRESIENSVIEIEAIRARISGDSV